MHIASCCLITLCKIGFSNYVIKLYVLLIISSFLHSWAASLFVFFSLLFSPSSPIAFLFFGIFVVLVILSHIIFHLGITAIEPVGLDSIPNHNKHFTSFNLFWHSSIHTPFPIQLSLSRGGRWSMACYFFHVLKHSFIWFYYKKSTLFLRASVCFSFTRSLQCLHHRQLKPNEVTDTHQTRHFTAGQQREGGESEKKQKNRLSHS